MNLIQYFLIFLFINLTIQEKYIDIHLLYSLSCDKDSIKDTVVIAYTNIVSKFKDYLDIIEMQSEILTNHPVLTARFKVEDFQQCGGGSSGYMNFSEDKSGQYAIMYMPNNEDPSKNWDNAKKQEMLDILNGADAALDFFQTMLGSPANGVTLGHSPYIDMTWPRDSINQESCDYGYGDIWHNKNFLWAYYGNEENNPEGVPYITPPYVSSMLTTTGLTRMMTLCALVKKNNERIGIISSDLLLDRFFKEVIERYRPTHNSHIAVIQLNGTIAFTLNNTLEEFFTEKYDNSITYPDLYNSKPLQNQSSEFQRIYELLLMNKTGPNGEIHEFSNKQIEMVINNELYIVTWSDLIYNTFYLLFLTPITDLDELASWKTDKKIIIFRYNTGEMIGKDTISITNTGSLPISVSLRKDLSDVYITDIDELYEVKQNETYTFNITANLTQCYGSSGISVDGYCVLPFVSLFNPHPSTGRCFHDISFNSIGMLNDCKLSDIGLEFKQCKDTDLPIRVYYKEPQMCTKGLKIPEKDVNIPCDNISKSWYFYLQVVFSVITVLLSLFIFIIFTLRKYLWVALTTQRTYIISIGFGYIIYTVSCLVLTGTSGDNSCWVGIYFYYFANVFISSSNYCITHHTSEEEIKKNMILESDYIYYLKRFGVIFLLTSILSASLNQNTFVYEYDREGIPIFYESCGADVLNIALSLGCSLIAYFLSIVDCFKLLRVKLEYKVLTMIVGLLIGNCLFIVLNCLFAFHAISFSNALMVVAFYIVISILYYIIVPSLLRIKIINNSKTAVVGPYATINGTYTAVLADPISRYCLMFHMRDLHLEENIYYFLDSIKFYKYGNNPMCNLKKLHVYAQRIIDRYIKDGSKYQINISSALKAEILKSYNVTNPDVSMFEKVDQEVFHLIVQNCGQSFLASIHATKAKDLMRWFNGFEQMNPELQDAVVEKIVAYREEQKIKNENDGKEGSDGGACVSSVFSRNESSDLAFQSIQHINPSAANTAILRTSHEVGSNNSASAGAVRITNYASHAHLLMSDSCRSIHNTALKMTNASNAPNAANIASALNNLKDTSATSSKNNDVLSPVEPFNS